jgi:putative transposase
VHRIFQRWVRAGVLEHVWDVLVEQRAELGGVDWTWQVAYAALGKARSGGDHVGRNPTARGKAGIKRSILVEAEGGPLERTLGWLSKCHALLIRYEKRRATSSGSSNSPARCSGTVDCGGSPVI